MVRDVAARQQGDVQANDNFKASSEAICSWMYHTGMSSPELVLPTDVGSEVVCPFCAASMDCMHLSWDSGLQRVIRGVDGHVLATDDIVASFVIFIEDDLVRGFPTDTVVGLWRGSLENVLGCELAAKGVCLHALEVFKMTIALWVARAAYFRHFGIAGNENKSVLFWHFVVNGLHCRPGLCSQYKRGSYNRERTPLSYDLSSFYNIYR